MGILSDITILKEIIKELCNLYKNLGICLERINALDASDHRYENKEFYTLHGEQEDRIKAINLKIKRIESRIF